jgi:hypothetical protein
MTVLNKLGEQMSEKEAIPSKIWEIVTTLTENMQQAAVRKAQDTGYDLEAGQIPFQETLINLSHDRDVLREAVEKGRIVQLPLKLQYRLLAEATKVKAQLEALVGGSDAVLPLESAVEDLSATIWQFNLQNLSSEVLSFESKMNDLKSQETQIKKVLSEARKIEKAISRLNELQVEAEGNFSKTAEFVEGAERNIEKLTALVEHSESAERSALGAASVIQQHEVDISASAASARNASAEISVAKERSDEIFTEITELRDAYAEIKQGMDALLTSSEQSLDSAKIAFHDSFDSLDKELRENVASLVESTTESLEGAIASSSNQLKEAIDQASVNFESLESTAEASEVARQGRAKTQLAESVAAFEVAEEEASNSSKSRLKALEEESQTNIEKHDTEASRLTSYLAELEGRIHNSIERATGYTLFHSFQKRQSDLKFSKLAWAAALLLCVFASVGLSWFFIHSLGSTHEINTLFFMKLSISLPIIFAITFCSVQYSKERRLEEEYAFKSAISISLEPYQKLVGQLVNSDDAAEKAKYTAFIISSINRVFTSPTGLVFDPEESGADTANNLLKTAGNVAETLVKLKTK